MRFKTENIEFSPIKRIQQEAQDTGAVSLAQGIPKFLPPLGIRKAAIKAVEQGKTDFYGPPRGIESLRKVVAAYHLKREKSFYNPDNEVIITAGALQGVTAALATFLSAGDELIIPTPSYFPFLNLPKILGIRPVLVPLKGANWRLRIGDLKRAINSKTAGILLVHPNNPTGTVYSKQELEKILKLAERYDLLVFVDEVYRWFVYPPSRKAPTSAKATAGRSGGQAVPGYTSLGKFKQFRERVVRVMSFSKAFSLSGWRIGYILADEKLATEILKTHEMMVTASASLPAQYAALAALSDFPNLPLKFAETLKRRKEKMRRRLEKLSQFFDFKDPEGTYYYFAKLLKEKDDRAFCRRVLREAGVALVPGSTFGDEGKGFVRFSFAAKEGEIDEAFDRLERYLLGGGQKSPSFEGLVRNAAGVTDDSRKVKSGYIFVAVPGATHDGHDFIPEAVKKGATCIVGERSPAEGKPFGLKGSQPEGLRNRRGSVPDYIRVDNSRRALGLLSSAWHGDPSSRLKVIGVTGTDGKTTTSNLLGAILNEGGIKTSVLSTLNAPGAHTTTPGATVLQKWLADEVDKGTKAAVLEVTSHGIAQQRIAGIRFEGAVLTNITPEHLDYHETFERYRETKSKLFRDISFAILNRDDRSFGRMVGVSGGEVVSYGRSSKALLRAAGVEVGEEGCRFNLVRGAEKHSVDLPLPGGYNVHNALAAVAAASMLEVDLGTAARALEQFDSSALTGRFEGIREIQDFKVIVDFAHTPNALAKVLNYAARVKPTGSRLLVVFGCAGERDQVKRPQMGKIAVRTADFAVITSEDPRSEDPEKIIDEVVQGCFAEGAVEGKNFVRVPDRREAIRFALKSALPGDYLLVLGKGHEPTMNIGGVERSWSDREVIKEEFRRL